MTIKKITHLEDKTIISISEPMFYGKEENQKYEINIPNVAAKLLLVLILCLGAVSCSGGSSDNVPSANSSDAGCVDAVGGDNISNLQNSLACKKFSEK